MYLKICVQGRLPETQKLFHQGCLRSGLPRGRRSPRRELQRRLMTRPCESNQKDATRCDKFLRGWRYKLSEDTRKPRRKKIGEDASKLKQGADDMPLGTPVQTFNGNRVLLLSTTDTLIIMVYYDACRVKRDE